MLSTIIFFATVLATGYAWGRANPISKLRFLDEKGAQQFSTTIIILALITAIVILTLQDKNVPEVLSQSLSAMLFGVAGGEIGIRQAIKPRKQNPEI